MKISDYSGPDQNYYTTTNNNNNKIEYTCLLKVVWFSLISQNLVLLFTITGDFNFVIYSQYNF